MKVARLAALAVAVALAFAALSGALSTAAAQGAAWDPPSGVGHSQFAPQDPEQGAIDPSASIAFYLRHVLPGVAATQWRGLTEWSFPSRYSLPSVNRTLGVSGEHRRQVGAVSRSRDVAVGR